MEQRLQTTADDTILEITEATSSKRRLSEKALLRRIENLKSSIGRFTTQLAAAEADLALITNAKNAA